MLCLTANAGFAAQITTIIDFSVTAFLFIYIFCASAFLKILFEQKLGKEKTFLRIVPGVIAFAFCAWVLQQTEITSIGIASLFVLSGLPVYWYMGKK